MTYQFTPEQEAWLRDLETTEEPQTEGWLHCFSNDTGKIGYCCLGRACVTLGLPTESGEHFTRFLGEKIVLPRPAVERLRLRSNCGQFLTPIGDDEKFHHLADLNDNGWTFKEIAQYIRSNPENVFLPIEEEKE